MSVRGITSNATADAIARPRLRSTTDALAGDERGRRERIAADLERVIDNPRELLQDVRLQVLRSVKEPENATSQELTWQNCGDDNGSDAGPCFSLFEDGEGIGV
jgi:uncharacterized protein YbjT (DUF2867 family)